MTTALTKQGNNGITLSRTDIGILEASGVIPSGVPEGVIAMFMRFVIESGLSPFRRQVHLIKRKAKDGERWVERYTIQTGIDGYRTIASRTGAYAGSDDYRYDEGLTEYEHITSNRKKITTATATVYRLVGGQRVPFTATARWDEYYPSNEKQGFMWNKMPYLMIGKCAEALALRKAFPDELSGIYTDEEMGQADSGDPITDVFGPPKPLREQIQKAPTSNTPEPETKAAEAIPEAKKEKKQVEDKRPNQSQLKRMFAIASSEKVDNKTLKNLIEKRYGLESSKDLTLKQYDELCGKEGNDGLIHLVGSGKLKLEDEEKQQ